jgi:hypothetical protein
MSTRRLPRRGQTGHGSSSREGRAAGNRGSTSRASSRARTPELIAEPSVAAAADEQPQGFRNRRAPPPKSYKGMIIAGVIVLAGLTAAFSYTPVMKSIYLSRIAKATGGEAIAAADDYLNFTNRGENSARYAVRRNRGPFEAELHIALEAHSFDALMDLADRHDLPPERLAITLNKAVDMYNRERHANSRFPQDLKEWAAKHENRDASIAAIRLLAARNDTGTAELLCMIARAKDQDPLRTVAALDGLALITQANNLGHILNLLSTPIADQVMAHSALRAKIVEHANADHLVRCVEMLGHELPGVRALALDALAGPHMSLPDKPEFAQRRQDLGERIKTKLTPETNPIELAAALRAARGLRLNGARDAVLKLVPLAPGMQLPDIDNKFLSETLGARFVFSEPESARAASEELLLKLANALDDPNSREVAANALAVVTDPTFRNLRPGLDKLAAYGTDPVCFNALTTLVAKTFQRQDVVKANGDDLDRWKTFLAQDRPRYDRFQEIYSWFLENKQYQRVSDGKERLKKNKDFIDEASTQITAWQEDPKFVPPIGLTKGQIAALANDMKMLGMSVRKAWSGALE